MENVKTICPICGKHEMIIKTMPYSTIINGSLVKYKDTYCVCPESKNGYVFYPGTMVDDNLLAACNEYLKSQGKEVKENLKEAYAVIAEIRTAI